MNLTIVSPCSPSFRAVGDLTEPNKLAYAKRWGLKTSFPDITPCENDRGFHRLKLIMEAIETGDLILWMGADTIFTNFNIDCLDYYCGPARICAAWDIHGLQSDVMFLNPAEDLHQVLSEAYERRNEPLTGNFMDDSDQAALVSVLSGQKYRQNIPLNECQKRILIDKSNKNFNRYPSDWQPGDFIFHVPGMPLNMKVHYLREKLAAMG